MTTFYSLDENNELIEFEVKDIEGNYQKSSAPKQEISKDTVDWDIYDSVVAIDKIDGISMVASCEGHLSKNGDKLAYDNPYFGLSGDKEVIFSFFETFKDRTKLPWEIIDFENELEKNVETFNSSVKVIFQIDDSKYFKTQSYENNQITFDFYKQMVIDRREDFETIELLAGIFNIYKNNNIQKNIVDLPKNVNNNNEKKEIIKPLPFQNTSFK